MLFDAATEQLNDSNTTYDFKVDGGSFVCFFLN